MRLVSLSVSKLFGEFSYHVDFPSEKNIRIITGPNGYGKTKLLNILSSILSNNSLFFTKLVFETITINFEKEISIGIKKIGDVYSDQVTFRMTEKEEIIEEFSNEQIIVTQEMLSRLIGDYRVITPNKFIRVRTSPEGGETHEDIPYEEVIKKLRRRLPPSRLKKKVQFASARGLEILSSLKVHVIKAHRLYTEIQTFNEWSNDTEVEEIMTIEKFAGDLNKLMADVSIAYNRQSQELDSTFPRRLIDYNAFFSQDEYEKRFSIVSTKQKKLATYGLFPTTFEILRYSIEDAKALSVYLQDFEKKLSVFDEMLAKLELFTSLLNIDRLAFKTIKMSNEKGFFFENRNGTLIDGKDLSSGEQHEVVLLYDLIFNIRKHSLLLIDEPEISLHVAWQRCFLDDLTRIISASDSQAIVATHSPSIIDENWDLVYTLN